MLIIIIIYFSNKLIITLIIF